jgi:hypothetical protein
MYTPNKMMTVTVDIWCARNSPIRRLYPSSRTIAFPMAIKTIGTHASVYLNTIPSSRL